MLEMAVGLDSGPWQTKVAVPLTQERDPRPATKEVRQTDEELLLRYRETGDRDAFTQLEQRYERELFAYLRRYLGNAEMAEDALQAAFLQVHLKCDQFKFEENRRFRPWLYTIATNQAIDARRKNKRHVMVSLDRTGSDIGDDGGVLLDLLLTEEASPEAVAIAMEAREMVMSDLDQLPDHLAQVVRLVYFEGLMYREAARVIGGDEFPVGTVKSRLHAAIVKLKEMHGVVKT